MKYILITIFLSLSLASCEEVAHPSKFTVQMTDEKSVPISGAPLKSATFSHWEPGEGFGTDVADVIDAVTDEEGLAVFDHRSKTGSFTIYAMPLKGFYGSTGSHFKFKEVVAGRWTPENPTIPYLLKRKRNPIPLHAKTYVINHTTIPKKNFGCAYDLERGDWVAPHGKGVTSDIVFHLEVRRDNGDYDNDCTLTLNFSNEGDGLINSPKPLNEGSELRLDYLAPDEGYKSTLSVRAFTDPAAKVRHEGFERTQNYFLRVRTERDEDGQVVRANYAKVHGDFEFWFTGDMRFTYYFNPTPNDRNLEFDPKRNLLTDLEDAMRVSDP
jgi:hypothetical protein